MSAEPAAGPARVRVVGVGSGPGWPSVVALVSELPPLCNVALVVFTDEGDDPEARVKELAASSSYPVVRATDGVKINPETIYVVARDEDATFDSGSLRVGRRPPTAEVRAPVDRLLRSLAEGLGSSASAVILAGDGVDGSLGLKRIKEEGGLTAVEATTGGADTMARSAIATGLVDLVAPVGLLARRLVELQADAEVAGDEDQPDVEASLRDILGIVRIRSGHDFSNYKRATLFRRIARRMQVCSASTLPAYLQHLRDHPVEVSALLRDFLIRVTNFFREAEAFAAFQTRVLPHLFSSKGHGDQVRVWVAGCATGEEAYSIAMVLLEHAATVVDPPQIQVFATDIDDEALAEARIGRYPDTIALDVSAKRLERFFVKSGDHYTVRKELRDRVLFSPHNVLRDPPFSRLDLVTCRNLLIYLDREAQERVLRIFHFGLREDGFLFLGSSESAELAATQFQAVDAKQRIYARMPGAAALPLEGLRSQVAVPRAPQSEPQRRTLSFGELHHQMVERYAPPSVLVNDDLEVVHMSENAGRYLSFGGGEPTRQILRLVHPGLRLDLRAALYAARQSGHSSERRVTTVRGERNDWKVEMEVRTADLARGGRPLLLLLFRDAPEAEPTPAASLPTNAAIEPVVRELEDDLHRTRDQLRITVEQYETSLEELKASNEELHAINEELRSATEELELSREELQSVNEEQTTLNHELQSKIDELSRANGDLQNLMTSTDIAVVFLDRKGNITRFTDRAKDIFNIIASDVGRPLGHVTHQLDAADLPADAQRVLSTLCTVEREVRANDGRRFLVRILPYRSLEDRIDGVVMTFLNVTEVKRVEDALRDRETKLRLAERASEAGTWDYDPGAEAFKLSPECARLFGERRNLTLADLTSSIDAIDRERFLRALHRTTEPDDELDVDFRITVPGGGVRWLWVLGRAFAGDDASSVSGIAIDVTARRRTEAALRASERRFRLALRAAPIAVLSQDQQLRYTWGFVHGAEIDFTGQSDSDVFSPDEAAPLLALKRGVLDTGTRQRAELPLTFGGRTRTYDLHVEPVLDHDQVVGITTVGLDVSAGKEAERALSRADRRKDNFLATLAHELRTPLAPIRSAVDVLRLGVDPARATRSVDVMDRQLTQLVRLVDDLLDVARISEGKIQLRLESVRVQRLVDLTIEATRPALTHAGHELTVEVTGGELAVVDPARVVQVLSNLMLNAIRYTAPGGAIALSARADDRVLEVRVKDNGAGLAPDARAIVFDMFAQAHGARDNAQGGLGIGLNLVRLLVELHGGEVEARSEGLGKGSEFVVRFPQRRVASVGDGAEAR